MLKGECRVKQDESELRKITDAGELNNGQVNGQGKEQMEDIMIGSVAIPRKDEIGYKIHPDHWRRGYMDEALKLTIELFWRLPGKVFTSISTSLSPFSLFFHCAL